MKYLAMSLTGKPQTKMAHEFAKFIRVSGCNIIESRSFMLGSQMMGYCFVGGNWSAIAKLEAGLPNFERKHEVNIYPRKVELGEARADRLSYTIYLIALDRPGILEDVMAFLAAEDVEIIEVSGYHFQGRFTKALMASLTVSITLPTNLLISDFRERFIIFCDDLNLDATLEPDKQ